MFIRLFLIIALSISQLPLSAQDHSEKNTAEHTKHYKNFFGVFAGNTVIYQSNIHLPTAGIEYVREIFPRFGLGVISEVEIGYKILENKGNPNETEIYGRESAFLVLPAAFYRVYKGLLVYGGYGIELEKSENLGLLKVGVEYKLEMKRPGFYILPSLSWDHTKHFDGVVYGMVFAFGF